MFTLDKDTKVDKAKRTNKKQNGKERKMISTKQKNNGKFVDTFEIK